MKAVKAEAVKVEVVAETAVVVRRRRRRRGGSATCARIGWVCVCVRACVRACSQACVERGEVGG